MIQRYLINIETRNIFGVNNDLMRSFSFVSHRICNYHYYINGGLSDCALCSFLKTFLLKSRSTAENRSHSEMPVRWRRLRAILIIRRKKRQQGLRDNPIEL